MPRIPVQASITYLTRERMATGLVIDVSRVGLRVESQDPVHIGMRLALVLYLSNDQEPVMIEDATVQWAIGTHFGVKFVKWSENAEGRLNTFFWTRIQEKCQSLLRLMTDAPTTSLSINRLDPQVLSHEDAQLDLIGRRLEEFPWVGARSHVASKHEEHVSTHETEGRQLQLDLSGTNSPHNQSFPISGPYSSSLTLRYQGVTEELNRFSAAFGPPEVF